MSTSFYVIEDSLQQLADLREQAEAEGDSEALKAIDQEIALYLDREATKVSSYVGLIRLRQDQEENCAGEIERLTDLRNKARADVERLKAMALNVMQMFDVKALIDTRTGSGLRRQGNGGLQPLELELDWCDNTSVEENHLVWFNARMHFDEWCKLTENCGLTERELQDIENRSKLEPDTEAIRKALAQRVECPECKGKSTPDEDGPPGPFDCPRCGNRRSIPQTIPGAKLLERGEHVRIL
jgi:hypothetical protein